MLSVNTTIVLYHIFFNRIVSIPALLTANLVFRGWLLAFLVLFYPADTLCAEPVDASKLRAVTIVQSEGGGSYGEFSDALQKTLIDSGLVFTVIDPSQTIPNSGLVVAVGMKAATVVAASNASAILNIFIPKSGHEKLLQDFPQRLGTRTFSTIFLDQPLYRQANLIGVIAPGKKNVGLLHSSPADEIAKLGNELAVYGLKLQEQAVNPALPLAASLQEVLRRSDVLLVLPDTRIYNSSNIRNIAVAAFRSNIPLIGISSGYVKGGALCAVVSTPVQIAAQAAAIIRQFGETRVLPSAQYPQEFEVIVNEQVARSLNLQINIPAEMRNIINTRSTP